MLKTPKKIIWPKVSFILLTINDVKGVEKCLKSVNLQDYPKMKIDTVVVDNGSTDGSAEMAKKLGARVFIHPEGDLYSNWIRGMRRIKGDYFFYLEQDIVLRDKNFIKNMIYPHLIDKRLIATCTKEYPKADMHWAARFLSYHVSQCDPLLDFLTPKLENTFVETHKDYTVCKYELGKIPPIARMFYRVKYLKQTPSWKAENYFDHDFITQCVKAGFKYWGFVPKAGYYHYHVRDFGHLLRKRVRNLGMHYFPYNHETEYPWLHTNSKKEVVKIFGFVIYANTLILPLVRGFLRFLKYKDPVLLSEPVVTVGVTDILLWRFLTNKVGREIISNSFRTLFSQ